MEETVVLKLQTYNDLKQQIANLEKGMETAVNSAMEAHENLARMKSAYKPIIQEYISRNTYGSNFREFYESDMEKLVKQGIFNEMEALRIEMAEERHAQLVAQHEAQKAKDKAEALAGIESEEGKLTSSGDIMLAMAIMADDKELQQSPSDIALAQDDPFATTKGE